MIVSLAEEFSNIFLGHFTRLVLRVVQVQRTDASPWPHSI